LALLFLALAAAQQQRAQRATEKAVPPSKAFPFEQLTGRQTATIKSYQILTGDTRSGRLDLHVLPAGMAPHPPHRHVHVELLFDREGQMEVTIKSQTTLLGAGSCAYMASNDLHGYRNPQSSAVEVFRTRVGHGLANESRE
jgi:mannose-6-phosphate isomerase-like protein (cupin superfamily)